jgi:hypothetical protein
MHVDHVESRSVFSAYGKTPSSWDCRTHGSCLTVKTAVEPAGQDARVLDHVGCDRHRRRDDQRSWFLTIEQQQNVSPYRSVESHAGPPKALRVCSGTQRR